MNSMARIFSCLLLLGALAPLSRPAGADPALTTLHSFAAQAGGTGEGAAPDAPLVQGTDGNFYGTTHAGGSSNAGTVFKITPAGALTTLVDFDYKNGALPVSCLIQGNDGDFYGTTTAGNGSAHSAGSGQGTVFRMMPTGTLTTLVNFNGGDGASPSSGLILGSDGDFYGTTALGRAGGTVFKVKTNGTPQGTALSTLAAFTSGTGQSPAAGLVQGADGNFYGTTESGGRGGDGTIFQMTPTGTLSVMHAFAKSDGAQPAKSLLQGPDGDFYGTTLSGGSANGGTAFKITPLGVLTTLVNFTGANGTMPGGLCQGPDGDFYGTTQGGGSTGKGTAFQLTPTGTLTTLVNFTGANGASPAAPLVLGSDGDFYGTASAGGANNTGTIFALSVPGSNALPALSGLSPASGPIGTAVIITGTNLGGVSAVHFHNADASIFTVNGAGTQITAIVPTGAVSGTIRLIAGSAAQTATAFTVTAPATPSITSFSPASGVTGSSVVLTGPGLGAATSVTVGTVAASFTVDAVNQITVTVPGALPDGTASLAVSNVSGTATSATTFSVTNGAPLPTTLSPASGAVGTVLTITGTRLGGVTAVRFHDADATAFSVNAAGTQITVTVPAGALSGTLKVVTPAGTTQTQASFAVTPTWDAKDVAAASDGTARILWTRSDGAAGIWALNAQDVTSAVGTVYGPYADADGTWCATALGVAGDGTSRILWTRSDGAAGLWTMSAAGKVTTIGAVYGPYSGWKATDVSVAPSGAARILWTRYDGAAGLWTMRAADTVALIGTVYGPYSDDGGTWAATAVGTAGDGTAHLLWVRSDGAAGLWTLGTADTATEIGAVYGPYADSHGAWSATDLGTSADGTSQVLWDRTDGAAGLWTFSAADAMATIGAVYGPYAGFTAVSLDAANDAARVLWTRSDRAAGIWTFAPTDTQSRIGATYGPY